MPSAWIRTRATKDGGKRYRVEFRLGGRESKIQYAASFKTRRLANICVGWVEGELAARRVPDLGQLSAEAPVAPTVREAADRWRASRVDVEESTQIFHARP
jgi:hypothetical protein